MLTEINHSTPKEEGGLDFFLKKYFLYCLFLKHLDSQSLEHSGFFFKGESNFSYTWEYLNCTFFGFLRK